MSRTAEATLDKAVADARALRIDDAVVRARADECVRWSASVQAASAWTRWWWPAGALAVAAAVIAIAVIPRGARPEPSAALAAPPVVGVGPRVAITTSPGAVYAVVRSTPEATDVAVVSGAVTARLYPGAGPHRLRLIAGALEATASGTIYTVVMPESRRPYAVVHEGAVTVHDPSGERTVPAGQSWPPALHSFAVEVAALRLGHHQLAAPEAPPPREPPPPGGPPGSEPSDAAAIGGAPGSGGPVEPSGPLADAADSEQRWRRARQLRGQGHPRESLALLDELARRRDAVWSPIAIAEAMRIQASMLTDHRAVVQLGGSFLERYPGHALRREVIDLLCRAHRALGEAELPSVCLMGGAE